MSTVSRSLKKGSGDPESGSADGNGNGCRVLEVFLVHSVMISDYVRGRCNRREGIAIRNFKKEKKRI
jgi:hypothetical protein